MSNFTFMAERRPTDRFSFERARTSLSQVVYPVRWIVALALAAIVVLLFMFSASFIRTGEFGISAQLGTSGVQGDLDDVVLDGRTAFLLESATPLDGANEALDRAAEILRDRDDLNIAVIGHARVEGNEEFDNVRLSERRALLVIDELVERGIRFERLIPVAKGSEESLSTLWAGDELAIDQRVELVVVNPG